MYISKLILLTLHYSEGTAGVTTKGSRIRRDCSKDS